MRYLFYMIFILSNIEVLKGDYSIAPFLDYLQETGYYDIIKSIKLYFGEDIAIDVCEELTKSNDCETVVRFYMNPGGSKGKRVPIFKNITNTEITEITEIYQRIFEILENKYDITEEMRELIEVILSFYENLIKKMSEEEIISFIEKIIENPDILDYLYN